MRVRLRTIMAGEHGTAWPGDVIEVPDHVGEELVRTKQAEEAPFPFGVPGHDGRPSGKAAEQDGADDDESDVEEATNEPEAETATVQRRRKK